MQIKLNRDDKILVGLSWENLSEREEIDIDLMAIMLDKNEKFLNKTDLIFYNNLFSRTGALFHTGDNKTGNSDIDDEVILVNLRNIPNSIKYIKFGIFNQYDNENLGNISFRIARINNIYDTQGENLYTHILQNNDFNLIYIFSIEREAQDYVLNIKLKKIDDIEKDVFKRFNINPET